MKNQLSFQIDEHLFLAEPKTSDRHSLIHWLREEEISKQLFMVPFPYTEQDANRFIQFVTKTNQEAQKPVQWGLFYQGHGLVGAIGFQQPSFLNPYHLGVGYWLAKPFWGKGIMSKVLTWVCQYGFNQLDLVRIEAFVFKENLASCRVLEKVGFQKEGLLKKYVYKDHEFLDCILYAKTM